MGQQQIFMIILVLIIVVLGVLLGMQLIKTENVAFMEDEYNQIMLETAELFQATYEKPELFGGAAHNWSKVNFNHVACSFGTVASGDPRMCNSEDGTLSILANGNGRDNTHLVMSAVAHISGQDNHHLYTRQLNVYADSIIFVTEWIKR